MKVGQTSIVYFVSRLVSSVLGFVATIYFARLLGADPLGIYYLVLGVVAWLAIGGKIGISGAITKRVSEGEDREQYVVAGISFIAVLFVILSVGLLLFRPYIDDYLGHPATEYIVIILLMTLIWSIVTSLLIGLHLVHLKGILSPIKTGGQSLIQVGAVAIGLSLTGLFLGYIAGFLVVITIGGIFVVSRLQDIQLPEKRHFRSLFDYAKFSWLGNLESQMFSYTDVVILGFFVSTTLIGIYSIAWNIAMFLILFSGSISTTLFPEISERSARDDLQSVTNLLEDALSYAGLMLIPGLVGGIILGERILRIYGEEFTEGTTILVILIVAALIRAYQKQLLNTLNAVDRPDLSFRANALFVVVNLLLNVGLIYLYGWIGAAIATALSVGISFGLAAHYLRTIIEFAFPYDEIARQWIAALVMGLVVYGGLWIEEMHRLIGHNFATVLILVGLGAAVYFFLLLAISREFRTSVDRNLPVDVPLIRS